MLFTDVAKASGITYEGISYGVAWGDFNDDGNVDLWVNNHGATAILYQNQGDGTFKDVTSDLFDTDLRADFHGASWGDFDNDGDLDLIQLIGADVGNASLEDIEQANRLFVNENGVFVDRAIDLGLGYIGSRGRNPLWFDYNNDGLLDLLQGAIERPDGLVPATIFVQDTQSNKFTNLNSELELNLNSIRSGIFSDLVGDSTPELILSNPFTGISVYDSENTDISDTVLTENFQSKDFITEDFNGDLLPDLYFTRQGLSNSAFFLPSDRSINLNLNSEANQKGMTWQTTGKITLDLWTFGFGFDEINLEDIFIGASGLNPQDFNISLEADNDTITKLQLTLDPQDERFQGLKSFIPGEDEGLYIGYDSALGEWEISLSTPDRDLVAATIQAENDITATQSIGFNNDLKALRDRLLLNNGSQLIDSTQDSGLYDFFTPGVSTVAGDFDNDMDVDLYVVNASSAGNEPNVLYDNQGNGTFEPIQDLKAAAGSKLGIGDSVTTADYNNDGFLDLFVTNGEFPHLLVENAPYQLLENAGNDNHWLQIDLEGVASNRDGIGTKVYVTSGGTTQLRQQSGGMHNQVQNDSRLHFGLGDNTEIDEIRVEWSSGNVQTLRDVEVDQILEIQEFI